MSSGVVVAQAHHGADDNQQPSKGHISTIPVFGDVPWRILLGYMLVHGRLDHAGLNYIDGAIGRPRVNGLGMCRQHTGLNR